MEETKIKPFPREIMLVQVYFFVSGISLGHNFAQLCLLTPERYQPGYLGYAASEMAREDREDPGILGFLPLHNPLHTDFGLDLLTHF